MLVSTSDTVERSGRNLQTPWCTENEEVAHMMLTHDMENTLLLWNLSCQSWLFQNSRVRWLSSMHFGTVLRVPYITMEIFLALLEGSAARAIQGLALSARNYESAVEIMKVRFRRLRQIISAHTNLSSYLCTSRVLYRYFSVFSVNRPWISWWSTARRQCFWYHRHPDHYWDIVIGDVTRDGNVTRDGDGSVAISSKLGWLLSGLTRNPQNHNDSVVANLALLDSVDSADDITVQLQRFWDIEAIRIIECPVTKDDTFSSLVKFEDQNSRYVVSLPWSSLHPTSTNYSLCVKCLNLLRTRLQRDGTLFQQYQAMFHEKLQSGIIELVLEAEKAINDCFFLPHHGFTRQDKLTTKLHIAFDRSAKSDCGV